MIMLQCLIQLCPKRHPRLSSDSRALHSKNRARDLLQGTGQVESYLVTNEGDGLVTDPAVLAQHPNASDPNPFFEDLLQKPYLDQARHCNLYIYIHLIFI